MPEHFGFDIARFDLPVDEEFQESEESGCGWCGAPCGADYFVVVRGHHYTLCPTCWGRSPAYQELRREARGHESALSQLGIAAVKEP